MTKFSFRTVLWVDGKETDRCWMGGQWDTQINGGVVDAANDMRDWIIKTLANDSVRKTSPRPE